MDTADQTQIELSKKKIFFLFLGSCAFVAIGIWLYSCSEEFIHSRYLFRNPTFVRAAGIASIVFFGLCGAFAVTKLCDTQPGLVFNSSGIIDNTSIISGALVPWTEIVSAEILEMNRQEMILINLRDPEQYIARGGLLGRVLRNISYKTCGSPVVISSSTLKTDISELISVLNRYHKKYGKQ